MRTWQPYEPLPFDSPVDRYREDAAELLAAHRLGDPGAIRVIHQNHPRFLNDKISWLPKNLPDSEIRDSAFDLADAQVTLARWYNFRDWSALEAYVRFVLEPGSPAYPFEAAVEAVISGDAAALEGLLRANPGLVRARSARITNHDPPVHRATLLHYVAANGVEGYRQKTPKNAVEIATILLRAGAEPDALADLYGGECTTMSLLVSSCHPANAGVQADLVDVLVDFGAAVEPRGTGHWKSPLMTALVFGYRDTAEALLRRGARVADLAAAAGLGRPEDAARLLPDAGPESRHRALALAAQHGHVEIVRLLLDSGEDPNRYNPEGHHSHSTPMHQAALAGHGEMVRLLVERSARLDIRDRIYQGTPLGWALYSGKTEIAAYLRAEGAPE